MPLLKKAMKDSPHRISYPDRGVKSDLPIGNEISQTEMSFRRKKTNEQTVKTAKKSTPVTHFISDLYIYKNH